MKHITTNFSIIITISIILLALSCTNTLIVTNPCKKKCKKLSSECIGNCKQSYPPASYDSEMAKRQKSYSTYNNQGLYNCTEKCDKNLQGCLKRCDETKINSLSSKIE